MLSKTRSLGCVLYELKTLEMAFPQGQRDFPKMADFKDLGHFSGVISKYKRLFVP